MGVAAPTADHARRAPGTLSSPTLSRRPTLRMTRSPSACQTGSYPLNQAPEKRPPREAEQLVHVLAIEEPEVRDARLQARGLPPHSMPE
jgi:hypothetical protein